MSTEFPWRGTIVSIFIAPQGGAPMQGVETAERKARLGEVRQLALGSEQYRIESRIED